MAGVNKYTKLLIHCNGTAGSTTFTDSSDMAHTITSNGVEVDAVWYKFNQSGAFHDSTDYLKTDTSDDWKFLTGSFTIDLWVIPILDVPKTYHIIGQNSDTGDTTNWNVMIGTDNKLEFRNGDGSLSVKSTATLTNRAWNHLCVTRNGTSIVSYVGGVGGTPTTNSDSFSSSDIVYIGRNVAGTTQNPFTGGWIDEIRIQKGQAYWTADFTPPIAEYALPSYTENYYHNKVNGVRYFSKVRGLDVLKLGKVNSI